MITGRSSSPLLRMRTTQTPGTGGFTQYSKRSNVNVVWIFRAPYSYSPTSV